MLKFNSIEDAFEYKGTDQIIIIIDGVKYKCKRYIHPDKSIGGYIDSTSSVDEICSIGENCIIYDNVHLCNGVFINRNIIIHNNVHISKDVHIFNKVNIYNNVHITNNVGIFNRACIHNNVIIQDGVVISGNSHIHHSVEIHNYTRVYDETTIAYGSYITKQEDFMVVGNIGSRNDTITFTKNKEGTILVHTGCFNGTEEEFIKKINKTHRDNKYGKVYMNALKMFKLRQ